MIDKFSFWGTGTPTAEEVAYDRLISNIFTGITMLIVICWIAYVVCILILDKTDVKRKTDKIIVATCLAVGLYVSAFALIWIINLLTGNW